MRILVRNAYLLDMLSDKTPIGDIYIEDGKIVQIGGTIERECDSVIDASMMVAMPGLINSHTHIAMSLLRNFADDMAFWPWLTEKIWPKEAKLDDEKVYWGSMLSIAEMLLSGTTCFNDMYFFTENTIRAVGETGIRASISRGLITDEKLDEKLVEAIEMFEKYNGAFDGKLRIELGPHAPYTCDEKTLLMVNDLASKSGQKVHIHVSESMNENEISLKEKGMVPVKYLDSIGFLSDRVIAAHCVQLDEEDIDILARTGVSVAHNPASNMKLANGFAPTYEMHTKGVNIAIGTDGPSSNNNQDMFEEMHLAALISKGVTKEPMALPAFEILKMATINGAKALGIDHMVGTLEVGKQADIILVDLKSPHLYPVNNIISALVYSAGARDVHTVMVDGTILVSEGKLVEMNMEEILTNAQRCSSELLEA